MKDNLRVMVVGLGSMGKRRVRNLQALGVTNICGFDVRPDRRAEAVSLYGIEEISDPQRLTACDAAIISTAPAHHVEYIELMIRHKIPCFVELSLLVQNLPELEREARAAGVLVAPSATFRFHPIIRYVRDMVHSGTYGNVLNFTYHSGQYLPDWHPWEKISDYFVSNRDTSGCKEILSVEFHWLLDVFGFPQEVFNLTQRARQFPADIDDTYGVGLKCNETVGLVLIDLVSRFATRSLLVNFERAQLRWNWEDGCVRVYDAEKKQWEVVGFAPGRAHEGYNANLVEEMYIEEMRAFFGAVRSNDQYPLALADEISILELIEKIESLRKE